MRLEITINEAMQLKINWLGQSNTRIHGATVTKNCDCKIERMTNQTVNPVRRDQLSQCGKRGVQQEVQITGGEVSMYTSCATFTHSSEQYAKHTGELVIQGHQ